MINDLIKRLRKAADVLEALLDFDPATNTVAVKEIHKSIAQVKKGKSYNGKHWTQLPKNRAKMKQAIKKMQKAKGGK